MTIYELIKMSECDYDVYDDVFDAVVTCCDCDGYEHDTDNEYYYKFCNGIMKLTNIVKFNDNSVIADWTGMIKHNKAVLEEFMRKDWAQNYEDEDDFIYEWINEFNGWFAGYVSESTYKDFVENYMSRMEREVK